MCPQHCAHRLLDSIPVYYSRLFALVLKGLGHNGFSYIRFTNPYDSTQPLQQAAPEACTNWPGANWKSRKTSSQRSLIQQQPTQSSLCARKAHAPCLGSSSLVTASSTAEAKQTPPCPSKHPKIRENALKDDENWTKRSKLSAVPQDCNFTNTCPGINLIVWFHMMNQKNLESRSPTT